MTRIAGLLFDKDGTLFDFKATWGGWTRRVATLLADGSQERAQALASRLGYDLDTGAFAPGSAVIAHTTAEIRDLLLPLLPGTEADALLEQMNRMASETDVVEAVPLVPLFRRFSDMGLKLGLATNDAEVPARAHLERAAIAGHFDFVAGFDSGWGGKPDTGQMHAFLDATGLAPQEVAMVGDSLHDLDAGRAAGMRAVGVLTGIADRAALVPHADVVLDNIGQLPGWIASQS
jgi:phosphoglycolate phosphatase